MKKKDKPNGIIIFVVVIALLLFVTHCEELNKIPGVNVKAGGISVDVGDFHYTNGK